MNTHDWIHIRALTLRCIVGVHDYEKKIPRDVVVNLSLKTSLQQAGHSDKLMHTVDYATLCTTIAEFVEHSRFDLIESLAEGIAALCLQNKKVSEVRVEVEKPGAVLQARTVSVEITRNRPT